MSTNSGQGPPSWKVVQSLSGLFSLTHRSGKRRWISGVSFITDGNCSHPEGSGSTTKERKEHKKLRHHVFKASHEQIDKGMRECFSAKMIKTKKKKKLMEKRAAQRKAAEAAEKG